MDVRSAAHGVNEPLTLEGDVIDTWEATVTSLEGRFTVRPTSNYVLSCEKPRTIPLPGKPYIALRFRRAEP